MKAGLAAFSKSGRFDVSGTVEELVCPGGELPLFYVFSSRLISVRGIKKMKKFNAALRSNAGPTPAEITSRAIPVQRESMLLTSGTFHLSIDRQ